MKLQIINLSKTFKDKKIINDINYEFKPYSFYAICGESGCGKTTLLNIMSLILEADKGSKIIYDSIDYNEKNEEERRSFRLKNIGYVFQSFDLFENDTVFNNIALVIDSISNYSYSMKKRKIEEVLKQVDILKLKNKIVHDLSGGEKQRVAIARAIVNNPKIIFADEPTGSLDSYNSDLIFTLLRKISSNCTVICVTHDVELANKYCDYSLNFDNGKIIESNNNKTNDKKYKNLLMIERKKKDGGYLSDKFIFRHYVNNFKVKKIRSIISIALFTLSLFSIGLSSFLKDGISDSLKNSFSSIMNENSIVLKKKDSNTSVIDYFSANKNDVQTIAKNYEADIEYYGCKYLSNFESFFKDRNFVTNISRPFSMVLDGYNARSFNEFTYVKDFKDINEIYPRITNKLSEDEIVLSMNYATMKNVCRYLQVERTFEALGNYISNENFLINLNLANYDWQYSDNISLKVKAVIPSNEFLIFHDDQFFNEYFFEKRLMFPSSLNFKKEEEYPWVMKKVFYFKTKKFQSSLLNKLTNDENFKDYIFDSDNYKYSPKTCELGKPCYSNKVFVYSAYKSEVPYLLAKKLNKINKKFSNYYYSTNGGYLNLGTDFFTGFANETFFSTDKENVLNLSNQISHISLDKLENLVLPKGVLEGNALKTSDKIVHFSSRYKNLISGRYANKINEICISSGMAKNLNLNEINKDIFVGSIVEQKSINDDFKNIMHIVNLDVVGIVEEEKNYIYNKPEFSISFFRDILQISSFSLLPNSIVFEMDKQPTSKELDSYNTLFEEYKFSDPLESFDDGIEDTLKYLEYILIALSSVTMVSSFLLLIIINYIDVIESKKDYAILTVIGFSKREITRMQLYNCLVPSLVSFALSSSILIFTSKMLGSIITEKIGITTKIATSFNPFMIMFLVAVIISLLTTLFSKRPIKRINIAKELH